MYFKNVSKLLKICLTMYEKADKLNYFCLYFDSYNFFLLFLNLIQQHNICL